MGRQDVRGKKGKRGGGGEAAEGRSVKGTNLAAREAHGDNAEVSRLG